MTELSAAMRTVGPDCPQNWYLVAQSNELARGEIITRLLGAQEIVLYRGRYGGQVAAFAAHCAHAGCHLQHGEVVNDHLRCALHHRVIRADGHFITPDGGELPVATQLRFPVTERHGCIFVFAGADATFELPVPDLCLHGTATTRGLPTQTFPLAWSTLIANGMDIDHLQSVHDRKLRQEPTFQRTGPHSVRLDYSSRVTGRHLSDRIMKWISSDRIDTSITCIGGSMMLVESAVGSHRTFVLLSMCPSGGGTTIRALAGVAGSPDRLTARLAARLAAWLFHAFLKKDVGILHQMNWHEPHSAITVGDTLTQRLCQFFRGLPAFEPGIARPEPSRERSALRTVTGAA